MISGKIPRHGESEKQYLKQAVAQINFMLRSRDLRDMIGEDA